MGRYLKGGMDQTNFDSILSVLMKLLVTIELFVMILLCVITCNETPLLRLVWLVLRLVGRYFEYGDDIFCNETPFLRLFSYFAPLGDIFCNETIPFHTACISTTSTTLVIERPVASRHGGPNSMLMFKDGRCCFCNVCWIACIPESLALLPFVDLPFLEGVIS